MALHQPIDSFFVAVPDIRQQLSDHPPMHPRHGKRHTPISAVALTNADVDHIAGLLTLRERQAFTLYATPRVLDVLDGNSAFNVLNRDFVTRRPFSLDRAFEPVDSDGHAIGLRVEPFSVPGKVALFLEDPGPLG